MGSLLINPIQRIPRYVLLLRELIKYTPPTHPDFPLLQSSLNGIKESADLINERKRVAESNGNILRIHKLVFKDNQPLSVNYFSFVLWN